MDLHLAMLFYLVHEAYAPRFLVPAEDQQLQHFAAAVDLNIFYLLFASFFLASDIV